MIQQIRERCHKSGLHRLVAVVSAVAFLSGFALVTPAVADEDAILKRLEKLEQENAALKAELTGLKAEVKAAPKAVAAAPAPAAAAPAKVENFIKTKLPLELYGFVKADAIYSDSQTSELTFNAPAEGTAKKHQEFNMHAKDTRIGLKMGDLELGDGGKLEGRVEMDFWGNTADNTTTSGPRMRQAYVKLKYPKWDVLGGQTWDIFSPLNPSTLAFTIVWRAGNTGDRHPQLVFTRNFKDVLGGDVKSQIGLLDSKVDEQSNRGAPLLETYNSFTKKVNGRPATIGLGTLSGESEVSTTVHDRVTIWGAFAGLQAGLTDKASLKGELFTGAGLAAFRGGSATAIDTTGSRNKAVRSQGGWGELSYKLTKKIELNNGGGIDQVTSDTTSTSIWQHNYTYYSNIKYKLAESVTCGVEWQHFNTKYDTTAGGDANRYMASLIYSF